MSMLSNVLSGALGNIIDSVGNAADRLITSDEERLKLKNELIQLQLQYNLELQDKTVELEKEVTKRWISDNEHWVTRIVRPSVVVWLFFLFTVVILFDGNLWDFSVNPAYIPILETTLQTVVIAYFAGRSVEKSTKIYNSFKKSTP